MSFPSLKECQEAFPQSVAAIRVVATGNNAEGFSVRFYDVSEMAQLTYDIRSFVFVNQWKFSIDSVDYVKE